MTKKMFSSKTKFGALLAGGSIVCGAVGAYAEGALDGATALKTCVIGLGVIFFGVGLRDALESLPKK